MKKVIGSDINKQCIKTKGVKMRRRVEKLLIQYRERLEQSKSEKYGFSTEEAIVQNTIDMMCEAFIDELEEMLSLKEVVDIKESDVG